MTLKSGWMSCVALCGLVMTTQAFADCAKPFLAGDFGYSVCKDWPAYPGLTITALSQFESGYSASDDALRVNTISILPLSRLAIRNRWRRITKQRLLSRMPSLMKTCNSTPHVTSSRRT